MGVEVLRNKEKKGIHMWTRILLCSVLLLLCALSAPAPIFANGTSFFETPSDPSGHVLPLEDGQVSIKKENLQINVFEVSSEGLFNTGNPAMHADVNVKYEMVNETNQEMEVPVAFPQPRDTEKWEVQLDGNPIRITGQTDIGTRELTGPNPHEEWVNPRSKEVYEFGGEQVLTESVVLNTQTFDITLQPNQQHTLKVSYETKLGMDESRHLHPVYRLDYLLHPASNWSDFKDLSIELKVPKNARTYTNLPLEEGDAGLLEGSFEELPEENLVVFVSPDSGVFIDFFESTKGPFLFLIGLLVLFFVIVKWGLRRVAFAHQKWITPIFVLFLIFVGYDLLSFKILGYPLTMFQWIFLWIYSFILVLGWIVVINNRSKKLKQ